MHKVKIVKKYTWVDPAGCDDLVRYNCETQDYDFSLNQRFDSEADAISAYEKFAETFNPWEIESLRLEVRYYSVSA